MGSTLFLAGVCLIVLGIGGRAAFGISDRRFKKSLPPGEKMTPRHKGGKRVSDTGIGSGTVAVLVALFMGGGLGLGGGAGTGPGTGEATAPAQVEAEAEPAAEAEKTVETPEAAAAATVVTVRVHNKEIYVGETLCADREAFFAALSEQYSDGMTILLQDDYADNVTFEGAEGWLTEAAYTYRVETLE